MALVATLSTGLLAQDKPVAGAWIVTFLSGLVIIASNAYLAVLGVVLGSVRLSLMTATSPHGIPAIDYTGFDESAQS